MINRKELPRVATLPTFSEAYKVPMRVLDIVTAYDVEPVSQDIDGYPQYLCKQLAGETKKFIGELRVAESGLAFEQAIDDHLDRANEATADEVNEQQKEFCFNENECNILPESVRNDIRSTSKMIDSLCCKNESRNSERSEALKAKLLEHFSKPRRKGTSRSGRGGRGYARKAVEAAVECFNDCINKPSRVYKILKEAGVKKPNGKPIPVSTIGDVLRTIRNQRKESQNASTITEAR